VWNRQDWERPTVPVPQPYHSQIQQQLVCLEDQGDQDWLLK
jgi:hypothetical protein